MYKYLEMKYILANKTCKNKIINVIRNYINF